MLIINGIVHTMDGQTIPRGFVAVSGGKIARVGAMEDCPANWEGETVDAGGDHVLPGFIDAHSHLGMFGDAVGFEGDDGNEATDPCTPHLRAIDAIYPQDRCFQEAREGGVTTVLTGPGSANPVSGQFAAIKTAGRWVDEMIVKAPVAMKMALGENPKCVYNERHETPVTRMATAAIIRENLSKALEYGEKLDRAEEDEDEERPDFDPKLEALLPVVRGELPVHIHAHRADDILTAVRIAKEFGVKATLDHCTDGELISDELAKEGLPVFVGPTLGSKSKAELRHKSFTTPGALYRAGLTVSIITDAPVIPLENLTMCAGLAANAGLPMDEAWRAITINPARSLGIDSRVGSLEPGKDADFVLWTADPLTTIGGQAYMTVIDGKVVYRAE